MDFKRKLKTDRDSAGAYTSKLFRFDLRDGQYDRLLRKNFRNSDYLPQLGLGILEYRPKRSKSCGGATGEQFANMSSTSNNNNNCPKGRSPLANVSNHAQTIGAYSAANQTNPSLTQNGNGDVNLRKYISILNDEKFFLYRKRTAKQLPGEDYFTRLSDEMILQVFRWLPKKTLIRCSEVSKRFNRVAQDETLWTRLDLSCRSLREGAIGRVISRGTVILRLAQAHVSFPVFSPCSVEPNFQSKLQFLDLSMCTIEPDTLQQLLSHCRSLRKLSLENVPLSTGCCNEIAENENLEALNLTMCEGLECHNVLKLLQKLTKLHSLNISWTHLSRQSVEVLVTHVTPTLLRLNIAGCRQSMSDAALNKLITRCPDLLELDLSDCTQLSSEAITVVCKLKKLEYLSLSRCYNINVTSYLSLSELHSLLFLDVFGLLSDQAIAMLQTSFPGVGINKFMHSSVARPTVGTRRTSIWGLRTRD
ncbi:S-phase kinase-associated protein 2 [Wyeomyia smithii]|uniref:S-phase kinase-associated protein 2 n=1 Tax=Wyeomyia smithii TaxID=174621 RepID=UPI002467F86E|nr:S-phase kinase-associated protein 2 [Wyeomyia smithii]